MDWRGSDGTLVADFREKLDEIAKDLSHEGAVVRTRFNSKGKCADIYSANDMLARVSVKGSRGGPCHFLIMCGRSFQETWEVVFSRTLPGPVHILPSPDL